ncbi:hypothetical protein [Runella zeae]|uniref:hypothetical protein n=1 Tax=Runella zeae TaxID=94255 RepID=UPI0003F4D99E|nr:hypothetical protein [Runella zeae]
MGYYRVELKKRIEEKRALAVKIVEFMRSKMKHVNLSALGRELDITNIQPIVNTGTRKLPYKEADRVAIYLAKHYGFPYEPQAADTLSFQIEFSSKSQSVKIVGIGFEYIRNGQRTSLRSTSGREFSDIERQTKIAKLALIDKYITQL